MNDGSPMAAFVWRTLCPSIDVLLDTAAIGDDTMDPEALHRFRVALRRLRCDLRSLRPFLDRARVKDLRKRLSELDELVRPIRDGDVMIERLSRTAGRVHTSIDAEIVESIHQLLTTQTDAARFALREALESGRFDGLLGDLAGLNADAIVVDADATRFVEDLQQLNKQLWREVRRLAKRLLDDADDDELHRLRVRAKRARFLAEASTPELGRSAKRRARDAERIQRVLGEHQDSVVFSRQLLALPHPTTAHTLAIDALLAVETETRRKLRRRWRRRWHRADRD